MEDEERRGDDIEKRFPVPPPSSELPEAPKIEVRLPPASDPLRRGAVKPGGYRKLAIAATAASTFVAPILVLSVGGWWLDQRLHTSGICAFIGAIVGFIAGIVSLLRVIQQLNQ